MSGASLARPPRRAATLSGYHESVAAVVRHMHAHPELPLDLAAMAGIAHVSRCHFDRMFREITGVSPRRFQTAIRLNTASRLLLTTRRTVTDVCYDVGYESLGSFVARFSRTFGLSPQRLRELSTVLHAPWASESLRELVAECISDPRPPFLSGRVALGGAFAGLIFIGLFPTPMPDRAPLACTIVPAAGAFTIAAVPRQPAYLLGVAIASCERPLDLLINNAAARGSAGLVDPQNAGEVTLTLRPPAALDPPLNIALPYMFAERMAETHLQPTTAFQEAAL